MKSQIVEPTSAPPKQHEGEHDSGKDEYDAPSTGIVLLLWFGWPT